MEPLQHMVALRLEVPLERDLLELGPRRVKKGERGELEPEEERAE